MKQNFREAKHFLETRLNFEQQREWTLDGLEEHLRILKQFLEWCGSPDKVYTVIHIAGTKGKGSVCAYFESILRAAGYSIGCFTSPHLYSFLERFRLDGISCTEDDFAEGMLSLKEQLEKASADIKTDPPLPDYFTYFEITTLFAFLYFAAKKVDAVILETGLGGRLDATNICDSALTVITSIGLEHTEQLGLTLAAIAGEKAGIIKCGIPVISGVLDAEPQSVIRKIAEERSSPLYELGRDFVIIPQKDEMFSFQSMADKSVIADLQPKMYGEHQQRNAALSIAGILDLRQHNTFITDEHIRKGIAAASLRVRIEIVEKHGKPVLVFDGAHTKDSVNALWKTVKAKYPKKNITAVFGVSSGKDIDGILNELLPRVSEMIFTQHSSNARRVNPQELYEFVRQNKPEYLEKCFVISDCKAALEAAVKNAVKSTAADELVCITGSLFLAAELSELIQK